MENQKTFAEGINFKRNDNAPDFVVGKLTIKADAAIQFIEKFSKDNWMNLDIKKAKSGKYYIELDTYVGTYQSKLREIDDSLISSKTEDADLPF